MNAHVTLISGANTGIGKETALDLAKKGARVILLCRSLEKAKKAAEDIKKQFKEAQITLHQLDLASLKSVRNCAQTLIDTEDRIDILVNNAGNFPLLFYLECAVLLCTNNALILASFYYVITRDFMLA